MFSTDFIFRQQENLVDNQKCQAGFRPQQNTIATSCIYSDLRRCLLLYNTTIFRDKILANFGPQVLGVTSVFPQIVSVKTILFLKSKYIPNRSRINWFNWNPSFRPHLIKFSKTVFYEVNLVSQCSHLEVLLLSKFGSERGDFNWCRFWSS